MGDPKFSRRKYAKPSHPWKGERIKREDEYVRKYGLKNKKEFWKAESLLRHQRTQARIYLPRVLRKEEQAQREAEQLLKKLNRIGVLEQGSSLDDVLALSVESILTRRLQTLTFLKGLAATPDQARQLIIHGHIAVDGRRVNVPGYLVPRGEETAIEYAPTSPYQNEAHPIHRTKVAGVEPTTAAQDREAEEAKHRALKMAEEAEAEAKEDVLDKQPSDSDEADDGDEADEADATDAAESEASDEGDEAEKKGGDEE